ncbi:unnamed protein product [Pocillopora meandrina]|uniref:Ribosomal protein S14 n=1 Tax=Pocillopora meandrina TaxID=46732 RepID=A0AAU9Y7E7_9CNID|nr:unnamed protein product [Pocillopora meandrina]
MPRKGRKRARSSKTIAKKKFPIGELARRRKMLKEEFISNCGNCKYEQQKLIQNDVELGKKRVIETDIVRKRKLLKRKRFPKNMKFLLQKELAKDVQGRLSMPVMKSMVVQGRIEVQYWMLCG